MKDEKLTVIGSKSYEECQCVMLPTDKASKLYIAGNNLFNYEKERENGIGNCQNQHLYILSSEEIKEGDWYIKNNSSIHQSAGGEIEKGDYKNCKKIIATTDILLTDYVKVEGGFGSYNKVPRTSDDFIKAFVKAQGKIDKVLVEYEYKGREYVDEQDGIGYDKVVLKVAPDNTITIRAIQEEKKDYGIEYLKFIATRFAHECRLKGVVSNHETCTLFDNWIKQNL